MPIKKLRSFYKDTRIVLEAFRTPLGTLLAVPASIEEIYLHRQKILEHYDSLPAIDQALLFGEIGIVAGQVSLAAFNMYRQVDSFINIVRSGENIGEGVIKSAVHLCPFLAIGGVLSSAAFLAKEIRDKRVKSLEIESFEILVEELTENIKPLYKDYYPYLGSVGTDVNTAIERMKQLKKKVNEGKMSDVFAELEMKSLAELIQEQAYANYFGSNQPMPLTNIYQLAIEQKINHIELTSNQDRTHLSQLVISEQHLQNLSVGTPLLKKESDKRWLLMMLAATTFVLACGILLASVGVFPPTAGIALVVCAAAIGLLMPIAKKHIEKKEMSIENQLKSDSEAVESYLYGEGDNSLPARGLKEEDFVVISKRLETIVMKYNDDLSRPLRQLVDNENFKKAGCVEQIIALRKAVSDASSIKTAKWKYLAFKHHDLYKLINELPLNDVKATKEALDSFDKKCSKNEMIKAKNKLRLHTGRPNADARLSTDIKQNTIDPEQSRSVSRLFTP